MSITQTTPAEHVVRRIGSFASGYRVAPQPKPVIDDSPDGLWRRLKFAVNHNLADKAHELIDRLCTSPTAHFH